MCDWQTDMWLTDWLMCDWQTDMWLTGWLTCDWQTDVWLMSDAGVVFRCGWLYRWWWWTSSDWRTDVWLTDWRVIDSLTCDWQTDVWLTDWRVIDRLTCDWWVMLVLCSDVDDFIVDDDGRPVSQGKKKRHIIHDDALVSLDSVRPWWLTRYVCIWWWWYLLLCWSDKLLTTYEGHVTLCLFDLMTLISGLFWVQVFVAFHDHNKLMSHFVLNLSSDVHLCWPFDLHRLHLSCITLWGMISKRPRCKEHNLVNIQFIYIYTGP